MEAAFEFLMLNVSGELVWEWLGAGVERKQYMVNVTEQESWRKQRKGDVSHTGQHLYMCSSISKRELSRVSGTCSSVCCGFVRYVPRIMGAAHLLFPHTKLGREWVENEWSPQCDRLRCTKGHQVIFFQDPTKQGNAGEALSDQSLV